MNRIHRRGFLGAALAAPTLPVLDLARAAAVSRSLASDDRAPEAVASDESAWREIQTAFTVDRSLVNLNNGGVSPAPRFVQAAMDRHLAYTNELPSHHLWRVLEPQREAVRQRLARAWGVDAEEVGITRNASEGLQICQLGFDLKPGDEVLATDQDYPRMLTTFRQRERREGIVLKTFPIPVPSTKPDAIVALYEERITPRTRLILVCHVVNLTGQTLPVREVVELGRRHGIPTIVDGAHGFAHLDFKLSDLDCDYYATSLHKWLFAPIGTGLLYVRRERIPGLWPMMAAEPAQDGDIRKFEQIGTHPEAAALAIGEALTFHEGIGPANKLARLLYLRDRWARRLVEHERVSLNTSLEPGLAGGIANVHVAGVDTGALAAWLWETRKIYTIGIGHPDVDGLRVSPSVYTTLEELDRFCEAIEHVLAHGLPD
jgi:selenocysteine lyase/cysteine desulfurase